MMLELAERCEAATADQQTDLLREAFSVCSPKPAEPVGTGWYARFHAFERLLAAAGFLNAAMTLIAERDAADFSLNKSSMSVDMGGKDWRCQVGRRCRASGRTPALALCAAALRARATQVQA